MKKFYGVFDKKSNVYVDFLTSAHDADIVRQMTFSANSPRTIFNLYSEDFVVRVLAEVDEQTGVINQYPNTFVNLVEIADLIRDIDEVLDDEISH